MSWQAAWREYQTEHPDNDWYDFEEDYWGDDPVEDETDTDEEKWTYWDAEAEMYCLTPYGMTQFNDTEFDAIQEIGAREWETDSIEEDEEYSFEEADDEEEDEDYDIMHPNETREEFLEHENFD